MNVVILYFTSENVLISEHNLKTNALIQIKKLCFRCATTSMSSMTRAWFVHLELKWTPNSDHIQMTQRKCC